MCGCVCMCVGGPRCVWMGGWVGGCVGVGVGVGVWVWVCGCGWVCGWVSACCVCGGACVRTRGKIVLNKIFRNRTPMCAVE